MPAILTRRRTPRRGPVIDPDFRAFVRTFACVVCARGLLIRESDGWRPEFQQHSPTECAHVGRRGIGQKCSDWECLPLCRNRHHQYGPSSQHVLGKRFWTRHGLNRVELIAQLQELFTARAGGAGGLNSSLQIFIDHHYSYK